MNVVGNRAAAAAMTLFSVFGCGVAAAAHAPALASTTPVATIDGHPLPYSALEQMTAVKIAQMNTEREAQIRDITLGARRDRAAYLEISLDSLIDQRLLADEAAAKKTTPAALLAAISVPPVTDAAMHAFYDAQKAEINAPYERIKIMLRQYLEKQAVQRAHGAYYASLRKKYAVNVLLPPLREHVDATGPSRGPANAPVTIVEFADFQCPFCGRLNPELEKLLKAYPTQVRLVYRYLPLESLHPDALHAAEAAVCADRQGKFWPMHDLLYAEQDTLGLPALAEKAKRLGLDTQRFAACMSSGKAMPVITADQQAAATLGLMGTPATFIDGRFLNGAVTYHELTAVVNDELRRAGAPAPVSASASPSRAR